MRLNRMKDYELSDGNLSETQLTDKARKIKNQISDMEAEVSKLENNLAFFSNPTRENPLLKATYDSLDAKKKNWKDFAQATSDYYRTRSAKTRYLRGKEENPAEE